MFSYRAPKLARSEPADHSLERADRDWERSSGDLSELTREWVWETNGENRLVFVSDRVRTIMKAEPEEWIGRTLVDLASQASETAAISQLMAEQRAQRVFRNLALSIDTPEGVREVRFSGTPVVDDSGMFAGYRGIGADVTDLIQSGHKTDREYRRLYAAIQHISVGFALYDGQDRLVLCNNFFRRLYPQIAHMLVPGSRFEDHEGEIARLGLIVEAAGRVEEWLAERRRSRHEVRRRLVRKLSDGRWILISEFRTPAGDIVSVHQDITVAKQREEALRQSQSLFAMAFQHSPGMTAIAEIGDGTLIDVNEKWLRTYGWSRSRVIGKTVLELGIWADQDDRSRFINRLNASGRVRNQESQHRTRNGERLDVVVSGELIELDGKRRMLIVGHDVTDRKRAEIEIQKSEARLAGILRISPEAIIVVDETRKISLFNDGAERIFGYSADEMIGADLDVLIPEDRRQVHRQHMHRFAAAPHTSRTMAERSEIVGMRRDGTMFPCEASISKLEVDGERLYTVLLHDITSRKQSEAALVAAKEEAELANRAKSEFLANMSHELRTPLNAILGFSQVIRGQEFGAVGNAKYLEYAEDIHSSGEHLLDIISDILDLAKLDAGQEVLDETAVDLGHVVRTSIRLMRERGERAGIRVESEIGDAGCKFYGDERKIKQILINLLSNAIKFTERDGLVTVALDTCADGGRVITVRDTGIGMDPEQIPRILEPFAQIEGPLTRRHEGTGLGLPLVKRYCEMHGGTLNIQSSPGQGTTVRVRFRRDRSNIG